MREKPMKKRITLNLRSLIAIVAVTALLAGDGAALASGTIQKTIAANYMGIRIIVDGKEVTPTDASGNVAEPFMADGSTYPPVRAVGAALTVYLDGVYSTEYDPQWDAGAQTITVPLNYAANVNLELNGTGKYNERTFFGMYDISFNQ